VFLGLAALLAPVGGISRADDLMLLFGSGGTAAPPPSCSDSLNFSHACNSMYVAAIFH